MSTQTLTDPSTGAAFDEISLVDLAGVDTAIAPGRHPPSAAGPPSPPSIALARSARFAAAVDGAIEELAALETRKLRPPDHAVPLGGGSRAPMCLEYASAAPERLLGAQIPVAGGLDVTVHEPLGVVGIITPWNFPMTIASWGFAPALRRGQRRWC